MAKDDQYKHIIQLWRNERKTVELLEVKGSMYSTIRQLISNLEKEVKKIDSEDKVSVKIINTRIERLNRILRDLTKLRTHKIIHAIFNEELSTKGLAAEELDLVNSLQRNFDDHNKRCILGEAIMNFSAKTSADIGKKSTDMKFDFMTIRLLEDIPEIVDATAKEDDIKSFGPFKKEDVVKLPITYAKALIMKNAADRVDLPEL